MKWIMGLQVELTATAHKKPTKQRLASMEGSSGRGTKHGLRPAQRHNSNTNSPAHQDFSDYSNCCTPLPSGLAFVSESS